VTNLHGSSFDVRWMRCMLVYMIFFSPKSQDHDNLKTLGTRGNPTLLVASFYLLLFLILLFLLLKFYIGEERNESIVDHLERRGRILVALAYIGVCTLLCNMCLICKH
jgi:hypothetical protein